MRVLTFGGKMACIPRDLWRRIPSLVITHWFDGHYIKQASVMRELEPLRKDNEILRQERDKKRKTIGIFSDVQIKSRFYNKHTVAVSPRGRGSGL
jgi:hypothetical protein